MRRLGAIVVLAFLSPLAFASCSHSAEGESCELENGNDDCDEGLICRGPWEVSSKEPVCCPRPPAKPSSSSCEPKLQHHTPDPGVDAAPIPPGDGSSGGSGGTSGAGGSSGGGGSAGAAGGGGASGAAGSPSDAGSDAPSDAKPG
jgi:uncharacterized membrane protein YgcG